MPGQASTSDPPSFRGIRSAAIGAQLRAAISEDVVLAAGVLSYFAVGMGVMLTYVLKAPVAPELVRTFALGALAWMSAAVTAVFVPVKAT